MFERVSSGRSERQVAETRQGYRNNHFRRRRISSTTVRDMGHQSCEQQIRLSSEMEGDQGSSQCLEGYLVRCRIWTHDPSLEHCEDIRIQWTEAATDVIRNLAEEDGWQDSNWEELLIELIDLRS